MWQGNKISPNFLKTNETRKWMTDRINSQHQRTFVVQYFHTFRVRIVANNEWAVHIRSECADQLKGIVTNYFRKNDWGNIGQIQKWKSPKIVKGIPKFLLCLFKIACVKVGGLEGGDQAFLEFCKIEILHISNNSIDWSFRTRNNQNINQ